MHIARQAKLQEDGTVLLTLTYRCSPSALGGTEGTIESRLEQGEPPTLTVGVASAPAECTGENHTITLDEAPGPFQPGVAIAAARVENADSTSRAVDTARVKVG